MNTYRYLLLLISFLLLPPLVLAQKQNNIWYFGHHAGVDFNSAPPTPLLNGSMEAKVGCASIADRQTGALLFYTDGDSVWNRDHTLMPSGALSVGSASSAKSVLIVPMPGDALKYYIFFSDPRSVPLGLHYAVVDMRLDGGRGDVVGGSELLLETADDRLCGIRRCDNSGYWLITHARDTNAFYAYRVTQDGISDPVISYAGRTHHYTYVAQYSLDLLRASHDGRKLASVLVTRYNPFVDDSTAVELFDFDNATGAVKYSVAIGVPQPENHWTPSAICFSPDNTKLYVNAVQGKNATSFLNQYDITISDSITIRASRSVISTSMSTSGAAQIGPDDKIYVAYTGSDWLAVIGNPNASGLACAFNKQGLYLGTRKGVSYIEYSLPNLITTRVPSVPITADTSICQDDTVQLSTSGGATIEWSPAVGLSCTDCPTPLAFPKTTTTYHLTVTNASGCSATDSVTITVNPLPVADAGGDTAICAGTTVALYASGGVSYRWDSSPDLSCSDCPDPVAAPSRTTTYTVTVSNESGCTSVDSVTVTVLDLPTADAGKDTSICAGASLQLQASDGATWQWSPADGLDCIDCRTPVATPSATTTYHLTVTSTAGCSATDSVTVTVLPLPDVEAGDDIALCVGESTTLRASGGDTYHWSPEDGLSCADCTDPVATPIATTTYHVTATNAQGCEASDSVTVTIIDAASVDAGQSQPICLGESTQLEASDGATWKWEPRDGLSCTDCRSPIASPTATTRYTVTVSAAGGCSASDTVSVTVLPLPIVSAGEDVEMCAGGSVQLHATGGVSYRWSPAEGLSCTDCPDPIASLWSLTSFTVTAINEHGCTASDTVTVHVGNGRTVTAHIARNHHVLPGASTVVPVVLDESPGSIDTLLFSLSYNRGILRLRSVETAGLALDGWQREVLADTLGGISLRFVADGGRTVNAGELLALRFDGFLGDTLGSALPFSITLPNQPCVSVTTSPGLILLDSICGLSYRLIESSATKYALKQNDPNPFNPATRIGFSVAFDGPVGLEVFNAVGERVAVLVDEELSAGEYEAVWDASGASSGLYYYTLRSGSWSATRRMVVVK